jgi:NhaA family Na+:H+ antiporter
MIEKILITPFQKFVRIESFSGILLFLATIIALVWANSSFSDSYTALWQYKIGFSTEDYSLSKPLILWINDGLMAVFFFLIGLEIKRELLIGELNSVKKAAFPFFAAIGGMSVPVIIFLILNNNPDTLSGWGVPMATDIAFTLAILKLLGKRVPLSLKVFLTAFAIVDDLGAVLVIALFYSSSIQWTLISIAILLLLLLAFLSYKEIYLKYLYFLVGVVVWFLFLKSGIHPTIAGVLLAFTIPIRQKMDMKTFIVRLKRIVNNIERPSEINRPLLTKYQIEQIDDLEDWTSDVQSPLQHLEHKLHNWVAYFIMPVFALSNAGVVFSGNMNLDYSLMTNLALSLILGNCIGVMAFSFLGIKLKIAALPEGVTYWQILGIAVLAGVGFTMSIFIANLAFLDNPQLVDSAKIGILIGSAIAGILGYIILRLASKKDLE